MKLNFNEVKRPELEIVLNDEEKTELTLVAPQKYKVDNFVSIFESLTNKDTKDITQEDIFKCCATLLSSNKENKEITPEMVENIFSLDDVILLFKTYQEFILGIYKLKN